MSRKTFKPQSTLLNYLIRTFWNLCYQISLTAHSCQHRNIGLVVRGRIGNWTRKLWKKQLLANESLSSLMAGEQPCALLWPELVGWLGTVYSIPQCRSEPQLSESLLPFLHLTAAQKSGSGWGGTPQSDRLGSRCWLSCSGFPLCK